MYEETDDSCLPARSCQEANPMYEETDDSLSEGELESTWPCSIHKYCRVQRYREFVPVQWGRWGRPWSDAEGEARQALWRRTMLRLNLLESPFNWAGERKTPWGKPGERYKHRWGLVRQASRWGTWKFHPSTAYGAFPPHTQWFITSSWPLGG